MATKRKPVTKKKPARKPAPKAPTARQLEAQAKEHAVKEKQLRDESLVAFIDDLADGEYTLNVHKGGCKGDISIGAAPNLSKCMKKALQQPAFTLLAQDNFTTTLLREWIHLAQQNGTSADKITHAQAVLADIEKWRTANPLRVKTPD